MVNTLVEAYPSFGDPLQDVLCSIRVSSLRRKTLFNVEALPCRILIKVAAAKRNERKLGPDTTNVSLDVQQFDDLCYSHKSNACLGSVVQSSTISDYDLGVEGDLFKEPELIIEIARFAFPQAKIA